MIDKDYEKAKRNAVFLAEHELNDDQLEKLIEEKFKRARAYHKAFHSKREIEFTEQDWSQRGIGNEVLVTHDKQ